MQTQTKRVADSQPSAVFMAGGFGTVEDAARYLCISVVTLRREIRREQLRAYRVGGRKLLRLKREDCDAYLQAQQVRSAIDGGGR